MAAFKNHEEILEAAFRDPQNTAINLEPSNVNKVIKSGAYDADPDLHYTKTQLWDMEYNKAHNPGKYLRHILRSGSVRIFNVHKDVEDLEGKKIVTGPQALFHVEHSVTGTEDEPLNVWRIVHLDKDEDGKINEAFAKMGASPYLREFNEVYIREDLGKKLNRV
ncbi:hypothetical protein FP744_10002920 [Trichoderma asperellum]